MAAADIVIMDAEGAVIVDTADAADEERETERKITLTIAQM